MGDDNSNQSRPKFEKLSDDNYAKWVDNIRDYLYGDDLGDVFDCSELEVGEDGSELATPAAALARTTLTKKLGKLWVFLRTHLSDDVYRKTQDPDDVTFGDSVSLLRYLRKNWHNNSVYDRANIRGIFTELTLETCKDMNDFILQFKLQRSLMGKFGIGLLAIDEDALFEFHQKLPVAYQEKRLHVMANNMSLADALGYYKNVAACFADIPGSTHPSVIKKAESAHNAVEICRNFASTGNCSFGNKCRFTHVSQPHSGPSGNTSGAGRTYSFKGNCNFCGIKGHKVTDCRKKKQQESTKAAHDAASPPEEAANAAYDNSQEGQGADGDYDGAMLSLSDLAYGLHDNHDSEHDAVGADTARARDIVSAIHQGISTPLAVQGGVRMLVDGGATCVIIQDSRKLTNLRPANISVKVGGGVLTCTRVGDFCYIARVNGLLVFNRVVARLMPTFGFDVLPESIYLAAGATIVKGKSLALNQYLLTTCYCGTGSTDTAIFEIFARFWVFPSRQNYRSAPRASRPRVNGTR